MYGWIVEPTFVYADIYYCPICDLYGFGHDGDILDPKTGLVTTDKSITGEGWQGHSVDSVEWLYDEGKDLFGLYSIDVGDEYLKLYARNEFVFEMDWMRAFRKIDSTKIKKSESDWGFIEYDLSGAYIGDKYALAYGTKFVTDFIYDGYNQNGKNLEEKFAARLSSKWGIIDRSGSIAAPFIFEHIIFIDDASAFAKYNGKYGIFAVAQG